MFTIMPYFWRAMVIKAVFICSFVHHFIPIIVSILTLILLCSFVLKVSKLAVPNPVRLWTHYRRRRDQHAAQLQATTTTASRELLPHDGRCAAGSSNPRSQSAGSEGGFLQECNTHRAADLQTKEAWSLANCRAECRDDTWHSAWGKTAHKESTAESSYLFLRTKDGDGKMRCFLRTEKLLHSDLICLFYL